MRRRHVSPELITHFKAMEVNSLCIYLGHRTHELVANRMDDDELQMLAACIRSLAQFAHVLDGG
eukprot:8211433-Prorocentrum_lima.AAC.1